MQSRSLLSLVVIVQLRLCHQEPWQPPPHLQLRPILHFHRWAPLKLICGKLKMVLIRGPRA